MKRSIQVSSAEQEKNEIKLTSSMRVLAGEFGSLFNQRTTARGG